MNTNNTPRSVEEFIEDFFSNDSVRSRKFENKLKKAITTRDASIRAEKIYLVHRTMGMYPVNHSYHATLEDAKKSVQREIERIKVAGQYRKRSMKKIEPNKWHEDRDNKNENPHRGIAMWEWWEDHESNTESGHDYWENKESMEIIEITLTPTDTTTSISKKV